MKIYQMRTSSNHQELRRIPFDIVRLAFIHQGIFASPLLYPVDRIEATLRQEGILHQKEHLHTYDTEKEEFPVIMYYDDDTPLTPIQKLRLWLTRKLMPK